MLRGGTGGLTGGPNFDVQFPYLEFYTLTTENSITPAVFQLYNVICRLRLNTLAG